MSGDRLAHIEDVASGGIHHPLMTISRADVLALVEIAKAAQALSDANPSLGGKFATLHSALARLDSGAAA